MLSQASRSPRLVQTSSRAWATGRRMASSRVQSSAKAAYYRGGTSRALIFQEDELPRDQASRKELFLQAMGSRDPHGRQLNGMGAGVSSLSKICIIKSTASKDAKAHVDYTFVGMGIEGDETDYMGNCGNMSSAIGPYAFNERLLEHFKPEEYEKSQDVTVYVHNTNTGVIIRSKFRAEQGQARVDNETAIDGVSGLGTGVMLDFLRPGGSKTGKMLPTGNVVDKIDGVEVSCVDSANPNVFVRAADVGIEPTTLPSAFMELKAGRAALESIREQAAVLMGLCKKGDVPPRVIPKVAIVHPPMQQTSLSGEVIPAEQLDLVVRFISDTLPHRAIPLTGALCTATAAKIKGSVVEQCLGGKPAQDGVITIGHPSGRIQVDAKMDDIGQVESASVVRTARRLMEGRVFWNESQIA
jgi:2-methylaconitate cis-trans-isomerase PrpF